MHYGLCAQLIGARLLHVAAYAPSKRRAITRRDYALGQLRELCTWSAADETAEPPSEVHVITRRDYEHRWQAPALLHGTACAPQPISSGGAVHISICMPCVSRTTWAYLHTASKPHVTAAETMR
jgi:hypothetical protein